MKNLHKKENFHKNKRKRGDDPTPTPKSHNVLIGSRESSPTNKNKENKIEHKIYKIDKNINKLTHSPKNTIAPIQQQDYTYIQTNTTKNK